MIDFGFAILDFGLGYQKMTRSTQRSAKIEYRGWKIAILDPQFSILHARYCGLCASAVKIFLGELASGNWTYFDFTC
jgi:hypothetical protein